MGFLHKLWSETLAGPMPDSGLGELRKYDSFSARSSPPADAAAANSSNEEMNITRSITIVRTNCSKYLRNISVDPCSAPESPSTPSTPTTPLTGKEKEDRQNHGFKYRGGDEISTFHRFVSAGTGTPRGDFREKIIS